MDMAYGEGPGEFGGGQGNARDVAYGYGTLERPSHKSLS
jgi:hypothetical protein